jgi:pimeloyl-ACP methyl ester carboxylesterase
LKIKLPSHSQKDAEDVPQTAGRKPSPLPAFQTRSAPGNAPAESPIEEHWLPLAEGRMRYLKTGDGPALILVHGLLGYSFSWRFTMPALAPHATVYAIDNLGAGFSSARLSFGGQSSASGNLDCTVRGAAERVLQFAAALGLREFDLLGTSHGGAVAMMAAAMCHERASHRAVGRPEPSADRLSAHPRRLILVAPVNPWSPRGRTLAPFIASPLGSALFRCTIERWRSLDYLWLRRLFGDASKIPPDSLAGYRTPILQNHGFRYGSSIVKTWLADLADLESVLPKIRDYPTLLIWGTDDRAVSFASADALSKNFSNARIVAFEGAGHLPYEECPEEFNRALIDFLTSS